MITDNISKVEFGDIVLISFPFTDEKRFKKRPALIINNAEDGDILVARITSQLYFSQYDILIEDWEKSGLKLPSVIRLHKLASLEKSMIESLLGVISDSVKKKVKIQFLKLID